MMSTETREIKRKFTEKSERNKVINWFMVIGTTMLYVLYFGALVETVYLKKIDIALAIIISICSVLAIIINCYTYIKLPTSGKLAGGALISYMTIYSIYLIFAGNSFVKMSMIPVITAAILFYNKKLSKFFCMWGSIINVIYIIVLTLSKSENLPQKFSGI